MFIRVDLNSNLLPTTPHLNVPNYLKSLHVLTRRRDVLARFYNSQAYYQSCANKLSEGERRRKMIEKLTSPFTWKQFIFELLMIGETFLPLTYHYTVTLLSFPPRSPRHDDPCDGASLQLCREYWPETGQISGAKFRCRQHCTFLCWEFDLIPLTLHSPV